MRRTLKVLRSVCYWCSHVILSKDDHTFRPSKNAKKRLAAIATRTARKTCPCCGGTQPIWTRSGITLKRDFSSAPSTSFASDGELQHAVGVLNNNEVFSILDNVPVEDAKALGFGFNLSSLMVSVFLCPPVIMRPSVASSESSRTRGHDDLTLKLQGKRGKQIKLKDSMPSF